MFNLSVKDHFFNEENKAIRLIYVYYKYFETKTSLKLLPPTNPCIFLETPTAIEMLSIVTS